MARESENDADATEEDLDAYVTNASAPRKEALMDLLRELAREFQDYKPLAVAEENEDEAGPSWR